MTDDATGESMRGKRTVRGLIVALVAMMTVSMLSTVALAAPTSDKQDVADKINELAADTDSRRASWMMRMAARAVERGLADELWEDDATPANTATFRADALAVGLLNRAARRSDAADALQDLKARLAEIDRGLAVDRLEAAVASQGKERKIARAKRLIDRGDALVDSGRYRRAVRVYMRAWRAADRGMGDGVPPVTPPASNPDVGLAVDYSSDGTTWHAADSAGAVTWDDTPIDFRFVVTNTGDVDLTNVSMTDSVFADEVAANCSVPNLAPGESYTCTLDNEWLSVGDHVNTATVTASGGSVTVNDSNSVYLEVRPGAWG